MSRVINTANPGTERNRLRRTIAEILRHLMFKRSLDDETRDMAAALVYALRGIAETVEVTVEAWEKRNYFLKADRFRLEWEWALPASRRLQELIVEGRWDRLPDELAALAPHFADIRISRMMRDASTWKASYELLLQEQKETP
ncbi:MAG TPA: hypothetical protein GX702_04700 [Chloroflexi bacterium]|jgi:hypothetical protein|nr:hypothetical protein [Chloroflexota bacterium]